MASRLSSAFPSSLEAQLDLTDLPALPETPPSHPQEMPHALQNHRPGSLEEHQNCTRNSAAVGRCFRPWSSYARELKTRHDYWKDALHQIAAGSDPLQMASTGLGTGGAGPPGRFASRILAERRAGRGALSRRGDALSPPSHAARLAASRAVQAPPRLYALQQSLFPSTVPQAAAIRPAPAAPSIRRPHPRLADRVAVDSAPLSAGEDARVLRDTMNQKHRRLLWTPPPTMLTLSLSPAATKPKARAILAAIRTLKRIEQDQRPATPEERQALARFPGFGPVALGSFPIRSPAATKTTPGSTLGEELQRPAHAGGLRQRQAHHLYRLLHLARWSSRPCTTALARLGVPQRCHRAGARLRHRATSWPSPGRHALHRRGAGPPLRAHRPGAAPRPRHPHRALPRHPPARGPHRRRHRQRAVRRPASCDYHGDAPRPA